MDAILDLRVCRVDVDVKTTGRLRRGQTINIRMMGYENKHRVNGIVKKGSRATLWAGDRDNQHFMLRPTGTLLASVVLSTPFVPDAKELAYQKRNGPSAGGVPMDAMAIVDATGMRAVLQEFVILRTLVLTHEEEIVDLREKLAHERELAFQRIDSMRVTEERWNRELRETMQGLEEARERSRGHQSACIARPIDPFR